MTGAGRQEPVGLRWVLAGLWLVWALLCCLLSMQAMDPELARAVRGLPDSVQSLSRVVTVAGLGQWYLWPSGLGALGLAGVAAFETDPARARRYRRLALALAFVFVAVAASGLTADLIKVLVGRGRPKLLTESGFYGFAPLAFRGASYQSFPSGHATTAAAVAMAVAALIPCLRWPLTIFALIIAASRVIIGAHYAGDVIGGIAIGWFVAWMVREGFASRRVLFEHTPDGTIRRLDWPWPGRDGEKRS
jgi:undecaprenyl-diphosphatase